jgi:Fibronectin type III domain
MLSRLNRSQSLISTCFFVLATLIWHENVDAASLQLSWADNSQNEDGFDIERKTGNGGAFLALTTIPANQSSYTDPNLSNGTIYCYRVRAFNKAGGSPYSNEACATTAASAPTPPPPPTANTISTNIANGATLSGSSVIWTAVPSSVPVRVEFFIDGTLGTTEFQSPYRFNGDSGTLNTNSLANGSHQLKVRATYADGSIAERTVAVTVSNTSTPTANTISTNIANGATLNGSSVIWTAVPSGVPVRVEFFIDGTLGTTEFQSPYQFNGDPSGVLNTKTLANGSHQLKVRATYADSSIAERTVVVTVSNT